MSVLQITRGTTSAELARVEEVTPLRHFRVKNDDEETPATVVYNNRHDSLYCARCNTSNDCTHTARVRLCGILTHSVTKRVAK